MKTVEEIKAMLNEVRGTVEDFKEFSKTNEKILEVKILLKMEKIKEIFNKYSEILKELRDLRRICYKTDYLSYMNIYIDSDNCLVLVFDENDNIYPVIERRSYSYFLKLEANEKFEEEKSGNCKVSWCSEFKSTCTISIETAKRLIVPLDLEKMESRLVYCIQESLENIQKDFDKKKEKLIKQLDALKDIPFIDLNNIMELPLAYIYTIRDCLEGVRKFRLARLIGFEQITENDFYEQLDEVLNNLIIPLSKKGNDVKIIREEV
jgi:hypothetical protein